MRLPAKTRAARAWLLAALAAAGGVVAQTQTLAPTTPTHPTSPAAAAAPSHAQIQVVLDELRHDPNLGTPRTVRSLHWIEPRSDPARRPAAASNWIVGLFEFLSEVTGFLLWVALAIGFAVALVWIYRLLRARSGRSRLLRPAPVSHVGGLDIRPDSLPDDVGQAALALLDAGRTRDALSLLYRASLSRAVHRFGIRIEDSFTEGEAQRAMALRLDPMRAQYVAELIAQWQSTVYAGRADAIQPLRALCLGFSPALDAAMP